MIRPRRQDTNHAAIAEAFRRIGFCVRNTHMVGDGFPDLCIAKSGRTALVEIKDGTRPPSQRRLTDAEISFIESWPGLVFVVETIDHVLTIEKAWRE